SAVTSSQPGGPFFVWKDLSAIGPEISGAFTALAAPKVARDEGIAGPFDIGFAFPFFSGAQASGVYTQLYVSPNGFVTFSPFSGDTSTNRALPGVLAPTNMIALFWDDLDASTGAGRVFLDRDPIHGTFTLQFHNVRFKSSGSTVSCQLILKTTGEIVLQYLTSAIPAACTVGLQNAAGDQGLQLAFNSAFVQSNLAVRLTPVSW